MFEISESFSEGYSPVRRHEFWPHPRPACRILDNIPSRSEAKDLARAGGAGAECLSHGPSGDCGDAEASEAKAALDPSGTVGRLVPREAARGQFGKPSPQSIQKLNEINGA